MLPTKQTALEGGMAQLGAVSGEISVRDAVFAERRPMYRALALELEPRIITVL